MYATYAELIAEVDSMILVMLTDDQNLGEVDQDICELMLEKASSVIDSKIGMRYQLPLATPLPNALKNWCIDIAMFYLYGRRAQAPGEVWQSRYDRASADLNKVAIGQMTLGYEDPQGAAQRRTVFFSTPAQRFTSSRNRAI